MIYIKKKAYKKLGFLFLSIAILSLCLTCNKDETNFTVNYKPFTTTYDFVFLDAKTGEAIGENSELQVSVEFKGQDATLVRDISNVINTIYKSDKGFLSIGVKTDTKFPSQANPIQFTLISSATGYVTTSLPITIYDTIHSSLSIMMVNLTDAPSGISISESNSLVTNNGVVNNDLTLSSTTVNNLNTITTVSIPQGTVLKDKNGIALNGTANVRLLYGDNSNTSVGVFPGGGLTTKLSIDNIVSDGMFYSAGFVDLVITDQTGKQAAVIENNPIQAKVEVPANTYNPETDALTQPGDIIPVWSYNMDEGKWVLEFNDTIKMVEGRLVVESEISHLSIYNWDFSSFTCTNSSASHPTIHIKSNVYTSANVVLLYLTARRQSDLKEVGRTSNFYLSNFTGTFGFLLSYGFNQPILFGAVETYTNEVLGSQIIYNTCTSGNYDLFISPGTGPVLDAITLLHITITGKCGSVSVNPSAGFYYKRLSPTPSDWISGYMYNGVTELSVFPNSTYRISGYFNGQTRQYDIQIGEPNHTYYQVIDVNLPAEFCK